MIVGRKCDKITRRLRTRLGGGTGRRRGLKILRGQPLVGSIPTRATEFTRKNSPFDLAGEVRQANRVQPGATASAL